MSEHPRDWIGEQLARERELLLMIDSLAEPDPIPALFGADLMQEYVNLYRGTEFEDLAEIGPWLVRLGTPQAEVVQDLLSNPQRHWGWLASADRIDLRELTRHWLDRLLLEEDGQRSLYRFQDPRVMARSLAHLQPAQFPLLLGPLHSLLCWEANRWQTYDNPRPGPASFSQPAPWLYPEPPSIAREIRLGNLEQWLWENQPEATTALAKERILRDWLDECLSLSERWQWHAPQQLYLLLEKRRGKNASSPLWPPLTGESPSAHYARCRLAFAEITEPDHCP